MSTRECSSQKGRSSLQTSGAFTAATHRLSISYEPWVSNRNILRDETQFEDPHAFNPERYLVLVDEETAKRRDPKNYSFGFGRRVRPLYLSVYTPDNTSPLDLPREASGAVVGLDLDGVIPCNNEHHQGSRREREADRARGKVRERSLQV